MISTINVSLPSQLKNEADELVKEGYYASFSDLVRTSVRKLLESKYDIWVAEAKKDYKNGKLKTISDMKEIGSYLDTLGK
jgi:Arc/MetJ-type ribon-helix-helix transcriptional regulator